MTTFTENESGLRKDGAQKRLNVSISSRQQKKNKEINAAPCSFPHCLTRSLRTAQRHSFPPVTYLKAMELRLQLGRDASSLHQDLKRSTEELL